MRWGFFLLVQVLFVVAVALTAEIVDGLRIKTMYGACHEHRQARKK
jgi:hypothetical protein